MGFFDELKKLTRPYDEDEDYMDEAEAVEEPVQERPRVNPFSASYGRESISPQPAQTPRPVRPKEGRVVSMGGVSQSQTQLVIVKPEDFDASAKLITEHLKNKRAVLMDMQTTPKQFIQRLVDFTSGVTFALDGSIRKINPSVVILTPSNMDLVGDQQEELENGGFYF